MESKLVIGGVQRGRGGKKEIKLTNICMLLYTYTKNKKTNFSQMMSSLVSLLGSSSEIALMTMNPNKRFRVEKNLLLSLEPGS